MKRFICSIFSLALFLAPLAALAAESRTYTEMVTVTVEDDEYSALNKAKTRAAEQALRSYMHDVYKDRSSTLDLTGDGTFIRDLEVVESSVSGWVSKELKAKIKVTINEEEVRAYLKRQGAVTGRNEDRRIVVMIIPGKMDSGDAPAVLDNVRAEIRRSLTAAEYTVIDSDDSAVQETLTEEADYNRMVQHLNGIADKLADKGEWLVLGKVDVAIAPNGSANIYRAMMTGKVVGLANREIMWEGNPDGSSRASKAEAKAALRLAAIAGGKSFAGEVVSALNSKTLTKERRGERFEFIFPTAGNYGLERKILKLLNDEIKGLKNVSKKTRGKGDMVIDVQYAGKIDDLVDLLYDNFQRDPLLKLWNPQIQGARVVFQ